MLGIANEGEKAFELDLILGWEISKQTFVGDTVFFEADGSFFSMKRSDYNQYIKK